MRVRASLLSVPLFIFIVLCVNLTLRRNIASDVRRIQIYKHTTPRVVIRSFTLPPMKYATKSLADLGPMDEVNPYILFFNRIPKSGSEVLLILIQWLQGWNNFRHVRLKDDNKGKLSRKEQVALVDDMQRKIKDEAIPLCFDKPVHFINFSTFDRQSPTYFNLIRDPVDNFVARYEFMSTTAKPYDNFFSVVIKNNIPIEKCIRMKRKDCNPRANDAYDFPISYFCGNDRRCMLHNNIWALNKAKANVEKYYPVVGVLEELNATLSILEAKLPYFFKGVQKMYYKDLLERYHININKKQLKITKFVRKHLKKLLVTEYQFYDWIKKRLFKQMKMV